MFERNPRIVLASGSRYRRDLLDRLCLPYEVDPADVDETAVPRETPAATACRLARDKAFAVAARHPGALIIGSDQTAALDGRALGKPGSHAAAREQLRAMSGRRVDFHTALCLLRVETGHYREALVNTDCLFRRLSPDAIERYLLRDRPYDCAGSAKVECLGIALLEHVRSDDPTALIGLPLIALVGMLTAEGVEVP